MGAPDAVLELVERFERNREQYLSPAYNETQVRREFLDPLFTALGWDVDNARGYAQQYKDVVHEDAIKVGLDTRAPDYSFRVGGQRKFFVEAKKPAVNLKNDPASAYQLRRYAWSGKLPLSILTDFQACVPQLIAPLAHVCAKNPCSERFDLVRKREKHRYTFRVEVLDLARSL